MPGGEWPLRGGEIGATLRRWRGSESALGAPTNWPSSLKTALQLALLSPTPIAILWGVSGILLYNEAYAAIAGTKHPSILGQSVFDAWPEVTDFHRGVLKAVFAGEAATFRETPMVLHRNGLPEEAWFNVDYSPILDESGQVAGILAIVIEETENVTARRTRDEAERHLRRRERELAQVQRISKVGGLEVDLRDGFKNRRSPEYLLVHGLPPEAAEETHEDWVARIHPQERAVVESHFRESVAGTATDYAAEYRIIRPSDGAERWISAVAEIERDENGKALRLVGAHLDVTERKRAEAQHHLLAQELAHRVKNSMAMIQAIASQTLRNAASLDEAGETFSARLSALARAHDLLVRGDGASASLLEIVDGVIGISGDAARFAIAGPEVVLAPRPALALTLILHELATNAVKYGALSNAMGTVTLNWRIDHIENEAQFRLRWQEQGGPPVVKPKRRGFGSRLIERTFPSVRARAQTAYPPGGLMFTLDCPLEALQSHDSEGG